MDKVLLLLTLFTLSPLSFAKAEISGSELYTNCRVEQYQLICMV